jgi:inositol 1,4,5-triphosphate receptor type 1
VLFIHSCVDQMKLYLYYIRKKMVESLSVTYFVQVEELLASMIFFITETESQDPFTCEGIPYKKRQKYMRETRVIDLLVDMLYYPFSDELYHFGELTQRHPITRICQLVYRLLKHCVKDYNYNKFYVAQFIELYFNQAMTATEQNNFRAENTITELLKNNEVLLDKQITKETIVNFVELCKGQMKNERFLNLLATLCSCNGEAVNSNQDDTCEILLENEDNNKALIMKMVANRGNDYEIILLEPEIDNRTLFISINNLYEVSLKRDDLRIFNYFKALINLNAEMCLQRNYRGINLLESVYTLDQVYQCTINESVHLLLRASFAKFLLHLHIDKDPLEQITVPNLARMWPDIVFHRSQLPHSRVSISIKLLALKPFVARFFGDLGGVQKAFETDFNTYIVELLGLVEAMVKLGFYNDEDDLILVIDPLISLLDGSLDIID